MLPEPVDRWFPRRGQCRICGVPGADQRHRVIEAIADAVGAGDGEEDVAADYDVPVEAVRACVQWAAEHPGGIERSETAATDERVMTDRPGNEIPLRIKVVKGDVLPEFPDECEPHTASPRGYLQWHEWAKEMERTHVQRQCKGCGLWSVWEPRSGGGSS